MSSLLSAARYLAQTHGFQPIYSDDPMFDAPVVLASQRDTFDAIHILSCLADGSDIRFVNVKHATDWLNQTAKAANV
jgi:hypothetical protein